MWKSTRTPNVAQARVGALSLIISGPIYPITCPLSKRKAGVRAQAEMYPCIRVYDPAHQACVGQSTLTLQPTHATMGASPVAISLTLYHTICPPGHRITGVRLAAKFFQLDVSVSPPIYAIVCVSPLVPPKLARQEWGLVLC